MTTIIFFLPFLLLFVVVAVYAERKISAFIQDRYGPMEVGYYGLLQTIADLLKLIQKEDIVPRSANRWLFLVAPILIFIIVFTSFSFLPIAPGWGGDLAESGVYFMLAILSLDVLGIIMAGWASNNKYSLLGAIRSAAQIIAYEVPLTISVLCVLVISQTLDLQQITLQQSIFSDTSTYLFGIKAMDIRVDGVGGFLTWNVIQSPLLIVAWIIFFIASLAECNRAPFDLPEAESELVAGFHTEYSGFRWSIIMLAEYGMMLLVSLLGAVLFFGGWATPLPNIGVVQLADWTTGERGTVASIFWAMFWLVTKVGVLVFMQMWVRWTFPRVRIDQLMTIGWKYLTPFALISLLVCSLWRLLMI